MASGVATQIIAKRHPEIVECMVISGTEQQLIDIMTNPTVVKEKDGGHLVRLWILKIMLLRLWGL